MTNAANALKDQAKSHPFVQAVFNAFPKAQILEIRTPQDVANEAQVDALPEVEDEWDPFDDELPDLTKIISEVTKC